MSIAVSENAGLGPCELSLDWTLSGKMSGVSPLPPHNKKIRRKTDAKPQSQINKNNNEKRRRELGNEYMEQLGDLLQINLKEMSSCKPDKAAILKEARDTIRNILAKQNNCSVCPIGCVDSACSQHPVQQGEVSSTETQAVLGAGHAGARNTEIASVIESLHHYTATLGLVVLQISAEGRIECVTENISDLIRWTRAELQHKSIYDYLHENDHDKLQPILCNLSAATTQSTLWTHQSALTDGSTNQQQQSLQQQHSFKPRAIRSRLWIKPASTGDAMEDQHSRSTYEDVLITASLIKTDTDENTGTVGTPSMLCVIRRPDDENKHHVADNTLMPHTSEHVTLKLDLSGKIIDTDFADQNLRNSLSKDVIGRSVQEMCHPQDVYQINSHLKDIMQSSNNMAQSQPYRLKVGTGPDVYVHVKAQSRLFRSNPTTKDGDFIMVTHTLLSENEIATLEATGSLITPLAGGSHHNNNNINNHSGLGGPLLAATVNGTRNGVSSSYDGTEDVFFNSDLNDFFPHSTWPEMDPVPTWDTRPDSRQSVTPVSTPTPSVPGYSPAAAPICPSPLHAYSAGVASPVTHNKSFSSGSSSQPGGHSSPSPLSAHFSTSAATAGHSSPSPLSSHFNQNTTSPSPAAQNPSTPSAHQFSNAFSFGQCESPFGIDPPPSADTKPEITPEVNNHDSERLRNLLTNKRSQLTNNNSNTSSNMMQKHLSNQNQQKSMMHQSNKDGSDLPRNSMDKSGHESQEIKNNNRILKGLLNQEDEEDKCDNSLQQPLLPPPRPRAQQTQDNKSGNHMLLRLLNEKSDDDDPDTKVNRNNSELRTQLLKQNHDDSSKNTSDNDEVLSILGLQGPANDNFSRPRKRHSTDPDEHAVTKRSTDSQVTSTGRSKLWENNKMLASLLANPPSAPTKPLPNPNPVLSRPFPPDSGPSKINARLSTASLPQPAVPVSQQQQQQNQSQHGSNMSAQQQQQQNQSRQTHMQRHGGYLNQMLSNSSNVDNNNQINQQQNMVNKMQQRQQQQQQVQFHNNEVPQYASPAANTGPDFRSTGAETYDSLSDILEVLDSQNETSSFLTSLIGSTGATNVNNLMGPRPNVGLVDGGGGGLHNAQQAISEIQKSLMQCETDVNHVGSPTVLPNTPPAYPTNQPQMNQSQTNYLPPPGYPARTGRYPARSPAYSQNSQQFAMQRQKMFSNLQQNHLQRLLHQQKQQQIVVPSSATASQDPMQIPGGIDSLLNNTAPPNVTLTRSSGVQQEPQLSPGFTSGMISPASQLSPGQRVMQSGPFSPHTSQSQGFSSQGIVQQGATHSTPAFCNTTSQQQWSQGSQARLSMQQQNPMLNAQLNAGGGTASAGGYQAAARQQFGARGRLPSPVSAAAVNSRQSPFPTMEASFASPSDSPTAATSSVATVTQHQNAVYPGQNHSNPATAYQNANQIRLQRQVSAPMATQHLPGGVGSPRSYGTQHDNYPPNSPLAYGPQDGLTYYDAMARQRQQQSMPNNGGNNGMNTTSEYVRQELRAVVGARTGGRPGSQGSSQHQQVQQQQQQMAMSPMGIGQMNPMGLTNLNTGQMGGMMQSSIMQSPSDLDALGLGFDTHDYYGGGGANR
ncbi:nuclear receptor coactivator 3-like isoform X2 [Ctenocephalides felis]|uniref:nuclear receptor coactivator 3-like isoform X2 n=1 Tax=Ctenocephalides felis TaxID=7515 RepID=UPI000E6E1316|nr:nuclear receptor coactivator 3-like isoform X2 [Ctenocephalides felis]